MQRITHNTSADHTCNVTASRSKNLQIACQTGGFSLLELVTVIAIICILAMLSVPMVSSAREKARQVDCRNNLRQIGVGITTYRAAHHGKNPDWLSNLFPDYIDDKYAYICKTDINQGTGRTRPPDMKTERAGEQRYSETIDNISNPQRLNDGANESIEANSYFYEFSAAPCAFGWDPKWGAAPSGGHTWEQWKKAQLEFGDEHSGTSADGSRLPYSRSRMPIVRCYHHHDRNTIPGTTKGNSRITEQPITINVSYAGNVFMAPLWWEGAVQPGDLND